MAHSKNTTSPAEQGFKAGKEDYDAMIAEHGKDPFETYKPNLRTDLLLEQAEAGYLNWSVGEAERFILERAGYILLELQKETDQNQDIFFEILIEQMMDFNNTGWHSFRG